MVILEAIQRQEEGYSESKTVEEWYTILTSFSTEPSTISISIVAQSDACHA
jgi:hypothetical protein